MRKKFGRAFIGLMLVAVTLLGIVPVSSALATAGDANGDGKINISDVSAVLKYIAKWDSIEVDSADADVTGDGKVNISDVSMLLKYIAGWDSVELPVLEDTLDLEGVEPVNYKDLDYDDSYSIADKEWLMSYYEETFETFLGVCKYQEDNGYELHSYSVKNGNHFATYVKGKELLHFYWIKCESELNVVLSKNCGDALPPKTPEVTSGEHKTSVTQLKSNVHNGMGYVIKLADGSFILYDGGYIGAEEEMWSALVDLNGGEENIVIRAWLLTHSHSDHYKAFSGFSDKYADRVTLERLIFSPVRSEDGDGDTYLNEGVKTDIAKFDGAKILYAHTGMTMKFCNVKLEILFAAEELYISDPRWGSGLVNLIDSNSTSMVSRVYTDDYSALFLGDATNHVANRMIIYYGDYLRSNMCQAAHHGYESFPLIGYRHIKAEIMWYPVTKECYDYYSKEDFSDVREAVRNSEWTKEIIVHDTRETRYFPE